MAAVNVRTGMSGAEIVALSKRHTMTEWSPQAAANPIPIEHAKGSWFWTPEGDKFLDFNSQLMCTNIGFTEPGMPGVFRIPDFHEFGADAPRPAAEVLAETEKILKFEGPHTVAAIIIESVVGTNGILIPPDGYMQGMRELCDRYGILLIADEVMGGFGRTGKWFAIDHWGVVPDMITMAKGLTSAYVQLGALGMRRHIADHFAEKVFGAGLTYNSHPLACATALATIDVYEEDGLIERAAESGKKLRAHHERMKAKHPCVGPIRNIGLFGIMELVRDPKSGTPIAGFNETVPEMAALGKFFRANGLYTIVRWNGFFTNPPLNISDEELDFAFDVIDRGLSEVDAALGLA